MDKMWLLIGFVWVVIGLIWFWKRYRYIPVGKEKGIVTEVRLELASYYREYNDGHMDRRMYRPYIRYTYKGNEYVAKSVIAYPEAKFFPGDEVTILVNRVNKELVRIVRK